MNIVIVSEFIPLGTCHYFNNGYMEKAASGLGEMFCNGKNSRKHWPLQYKLNDLVNSVKDHTINQGLVLQGNN